MHLLLITNLFPPQELGGYGRSMADFAWGLERRGHQLTVLCSDAPYLPQPDCDVKLNALIERSLQLKGDFKNGVHHLKDAKIRHKIDIKNHKVLLYQLQRVNFDGVLLGNLDLLGPNTVTSKTNDMPVLHHIGYVTHHLAGQPKDE